MGYGYDGVEFNVVVGNYLKIFYFKIFHVIVALLHDVEDGLLDVSSAQVLQDFGILGGYVKVLVYLSAGEDRHWVCKDTVLGGYFDDGAVVDAFRIVLAQLKILKEGFVVSVPRRICGLHRCTGWHRTSLLIGFVGGFEDFWNFYGIRGS